MDDRLRNALMLVHLIAVNVVSMPTTPAAQRSYDCTGKIRDVYYADPVDPSYFFTCVGPIAFAQRCNPPYLIYYEDRGYCDYPSFNEEDTVTTFTEVSTDDDVEDGTAITSLIPEETTFAYEDVFEAFVCPEDGKAGLYSNPYDRSTYYQCSETGRFWLMLCPWSLVFNEAENICDHPTNLQYTTTKLEYEPTSVIIEETTEASTTEHEYEPKPGTHYEGHTETTEAPTTKHEYEPKPGTHYEGHTDTTEAPTTKHEYEPKPGTHYEGHTETTEAPTTKHEYEPKPGTHYEGHTDTTEAPTTKHEYEPKPGTHYEGHTETTEAPTIEHEYEPKPGTHYEGHVEITTEENDVSFETLCASIDPTLILFANDETDCQAGLICINNVANQFKCPDGQWFVAINDGSGSFCPYAGTVERECNGYGQQLTTMHEYEPKPGTHYEGHTETTEAPTTKHEYEPKPGTHYEGHTETTEALTTKHEYEPKPGTHYDGHTETTEAPTTKHEYEPKPGTHYDGHTETTEAPTTKHEYEPKPGTHYEGHTETTEAPTTKHEYEPKPGTHYEGHIETTEEPTTKHEYEPRPGTHYDGHVELTTEENDVSFETLCASIDPTVILFANDETDCQAGLICINNVANQFKCPNGQWFVAINDGSGSYCPYAGTVERECNGYGQQPTTKHEYEPKPGTHYEGHTETTEAPTTKHEYEPKPGTHYEGHTETTEAPTTKHEYEPKPGTHYDGHTETTEEPTTKHEYEPKPGTHYDGHTETTEVPTTKHEYEPKPGTHYDGHTETTEEPTTKHEYEPKPGTHYDGHTETTEAPTTKHEYEPKPGTHYEGHIETTELPFFLTSTESSFSSEFVILEALCNAEDRDIRIFYNDVEDCQSGYICESRQLNRISCPNGNWFLAINDGTMVTCALEGTVERECSQSFPITTQMPDMCALPENHGKMFENDDDCGSFYFCVFGDNISVDCVEGLWFVGEERAATLDISSGCVEPELSGRICDPESGRSQTQLTTEQPTQIAEDVLCVGRPDQYHAVILNDCSQFFICYNEVSHLVQCAINTWYNPDYDPETGTPSACVDSVPAKTECITPE
ncbi:mucin-5AC-like isoform X2 [Anneissia japonica]|uniref:mucin-5AC-like isoform X2 n=1 Tax=Anneissia japonica TaxID=1529436 RepID=UPI001425B25E|nr:mucin-5AC-like isoform X2 [Anneissia japonica]